MCSCSKLHLLQAHTHTIPKWELLSTQMVSYYCNIKQCSTHGLKSIFHIRLSTQLDQSFVPHCTVSLRVCEQAIQMYWADENHEGNHWSFQHSSTSSIQEWDCALHGATKRAGNFISTLPSYPEQWINYNEQIHGECDIRNGGKWNQFRVAFLDLITLSSQTICQPP